MKFNPLSKEDLDNQLKSNVYYNYVVSLGDELNRSFYSDLLYVDQITSSRSYEKIISKKTVFDIEKIKRLLRNAWYTEIQLNLAKDNPEFICYANHWACVQCYYSVYLGVRSFLLAMNHSSAEKNTHSDTMELINKEIDNKPDLFPAPWRILCSGNPNNSEDLIFENIGNDIQISHTINSLSKEVSFVDRYCQLLKTTRSRSYAEKRAKYLVRRKKKRTGKADVEKILSSMYPTSIFDFLFRLRTRSNYRDSEIFMPDLMPQRKAVNFNNSLRSICFHSLVILEVLISAYIEKGQYKGIVELFLKSVRAESPLQNRFLKLFETDKKCVGIL